MVPHAARRWAGKLRGRHERRELSWNTMYSTATRGVPQNTQNGGILPGMG